MQNYTCFFQNHELEVFKWSFLNIPAPVRNAAMK